MDTQTLVGLAAIAALGALWIALCVLAACILLAIIVLGVQMWLQRDKTPITPDALLAAIQRVPATAQQYFETAQIIVRYLEQVSKPSEPGAPAKLTNEQKKARAMEFVQSQHPEAPRQEVSIAVEAAVHAAKSPGAGVVHVSSGPPLTRL